MKPAEKYVNDVLSGKILACKFIKQACERYLQDLKTGMDRGLYFDKKAAFYAIGFFAFLKHSKGRQFAGKPFILSPWQEFIIWNLFGWKKADGSRRFRSAYIEVAKKNGKSTLMAGIGLEMLIADNEAGSEVYTMATNRDQAKIVFTEAKNMVNVSPLLKKQVTVFEHNIHILSTFSKLEPLSSDANTFEGKNPHCSIIDEYHVHKTSEIFDNSASAMGARVQPMQLVITTAGLSKIGPCYELHEVCLKILDGVLQDDTLFTMIFTLDKEDEWEDEKVWIKANPNMDISVSRTFMREEMKKVLNQPSKRTNFLTKNLNIWTNARGVWIPDEKWIVCKTEKKPEDLLGKACFGGIDLASHVDINALALYFPQTGVPSDLLVWFWIPEGKLDSKEDGVNYRQWVAEGLIKTTPGNVIDIDTISADIIAIRRLYNLKSIAFDPARAYHGVIQNLQKEEIALSEFRQGFISMDAPTKELEKLVISKLLNHFGNPVLRWMNSNVDLKKDPAGNIKIDKQKSVNKVDGMVAAVMAIGEHMTKDNKKADPNVVYATMGIRSI